MSTTCNKNEKQQDAKNNAELWTKWTKTTLNRVLDEAVTGLSGPKSRRIFDDEKCVNLDVFRRRC